MTAESDPRERPKIGVLALQGDVREHLAMLRDVGADAVPVRRPAQLDDLDGLVLPGGESTTMSKLARVFDLLEPLQQAAKDGLPMYGTCAGMILLADRIEDGVEGQETIRGIDMVVRRNAFGRQVESFEAELALAHLETPFHATFIRAPWVEQVGPDVEVVATIATGPSAGRIVAVRQGRLLATSFHPEVTDDTRIHELFVGMVRQAAG